MSSVAYTEQEIQLAEMYLEGGTPIMEVEDMFRECSEHWYDIVWTACHRLYSRTGDRKFRRQTFGWQRP